MKHASKNWLWWFAFPFAHPTSGVFTTVWDTIYMPKGFNEPPDSIAKHEKVHIGQQQSWTKFGFLFWLFLYGLALPLFFNPFRYRWEYEAYREGSGFGHEHTISVLRSATYGFLPAWLHFWCVGDVRERLSNEQKGGQGNV